MKRLTRLDELLMKLSDGALINAEEKELLTLTNQSTIDGYLSVMELEQELSEIDSALPSDFDALVLSGISERTIEKRELKTALYNSFKSTFVGLMALILVIGPNNVLGSLSRGLSSPPVAIANSFQAENVVAGQLASASTDKNEVPVLIELVDGATKQKEFVTAVLRVNRKAPDQVSLFLPKYEASVLKEYQKRVAL